MKHINYTTNFWRLFLLVIAVIFPLFLLPEIATAGITEFFLSIFLAIGKWLSETMLGVIVLNIIDGVKSFLFYDSVKSDHWGALTGIGPSRIFDITDTATIGRIFHCPTPDPSIYHRDNIFSAWQLDEKANYLESVFKQCLRVQNR